MAEAELRALSEFNGAGDDVEVPAACLEVLARIAVTGTLRHDWATIQKSVVKATKSLLQKYREAAMRGTSLASEAEAARLEKVHEDICTQLALRTGAPFTLQRICEVLSTPSAYYVNVHQLTRGLEKLVNVTSNIMPAPPRYLPPPPATVQHVEESPHIKRARIERSVGDLDGEEHWPDAHHEPHHEAV